MTPEAFAGGAIATLVLHGVLAWALRRMQSSADATPLLQQRVTALEQWKEKQEQRRDADEGVQREILSVLARLEEQMRSVRRDMDAIAVRRAG